MIIVKDLQKAFGAGKPAIFRRPPGKPAADISGVRTPVKSPRNA